METLGERVARARGDRKWTQEQLAKEVTKRGFKIGQSGIGNIESGQTKRPDCIGELAIALGVTFEWLKTGKGAQYHPLLRTPSGMDAPPSETLSQTATGPTQRIQPIPAPEGRPDLPVWASAEAGDDGAMILTSGPIDHIHRRGQTRDAFAFAIIGDSMSPAIEHGQQVIVDPAKPPRPGDDCVFVHDDGQGTMLALVKRLLRAHPDRWHVRQFEPKKDFDLSRKKWPKAFKITEKRYA